MDSNTNITSATDVLLVPLHASVIENKRREDINDSS